ncbi:MAG: DsbA family protein, partial [Gemmatimonadota bacterium]|nr:DsbA family protein [Gemmatimonadota bacterium]
MARMKGFYMMLGVMAIVGGGVLAFMAMSGGSPLPSGPIDPAAIDAARSFGGYTIGNADAPVEIVEYADFECPACRETWALTMIDVKERLVRDGLVRLTFRDFPLQIHA